MFLAIVGNASSQEVLISEIPDYQTLNASIMRPDVETLMEWIREYKMAPKAFIDEEIDLRLMQFEAQEFGSSLSLLNHIQYTSSEFLLLVSKRMDVGSLQRRQLVERFQNTITNDKR